MKPLKQILVACGLMLTVLSYAQTVDYRERLQIGIKAGINVSNLYDSEGEDVTADYKLGFAGGAFLSIPIGPYLGIQPEVLYSQKGIIQRGSFLGANYTLERTQGYIDVPIYAQLKPVPQLTLLFGPQYSFLMHQRDRVTVGEFTREEETEFENDNIRKNIFGLATGFDININKFVIGARGAWDLQHNKGDGTSTNPRYKNVWFQATAGFKF